MWVKENDFDSLRQDVRELKDFIKWPSIDDNNHPMEQWIQQIARNLYRERERLEPKDDTRDILLALIEHLGLEYKHNKIVIQKKKGKR